MFSILIKSNHRNMVRLQKSRLIHNNILHKKLVYLFSTDQGQPKIKKETIDEECIRKQEEIQFRKRTMQDLEIKKIRERVQNTRGKFNPTLEYLKLYSNHFQIIILMAAVAFILIIFVVVGGVYQDPFTKRKKLIIVSQQFQKSIDSILRSIMSTQLCGSYSLNEVNSNSSRRKCQQIQSFVLQKTTRKYKVVILPTQQHIVNILPSSIILSKNMLSQFKKQDLLNLILIMQRLFNKKLHIKQLALSNAFVFFLIKIKQNTNTQMKLSSIYSKVYTKSQVYSAMDQISIHYGNSLQQLGDSLSGVLQTLRQQLYKQQSKFSLLRRFQNLLKKQ